MNIKKIAVLTNPMSNGNKKRINEIKNIIASYPDVLHFVIKNPDEVYKALNLCSDAGVDLLIINGGDGTIQNILTIILKDRPFSKIPFISILPAGSTNLIAKNIGINSPEKTALTSILNWAQNSNKKPRIHTFPTLKVTSLKSNYQLYGMFFGMGLIYKGSIFFNKYLNKYGLKGTIGVLITIIRMIIAVILKNKYYTGHININIEVDGKEYKDVNCLTLMATTLKSLIAGIKLNGNISKNLNCYFVKTNPRYLLRNILTLFKTRKSVHWIPENGYYNFKANSIKISGIFGFILDGELFEITDKSDILTIETNEDISFLTI
jgi:diacylglycerol kinase family enzyme